MKTCQEAGKVYRCENLIWCLWVVYYPLAPRLASTDVGNSKGGFVDASTLKVNLLAHRADAQVQHCAGAGTFREGLVYLCRGLATAFCRDFNGL
eukprot:CAMPEP_0206476520 /NCGR_PEP_ID=MMETSP0324_2-20121206/34777_1 /ASSEMBLY_ACC=CAM_ASM_000836 /TAXON_ID=2866 /ORGANISM="Crypthecodinium cohnii, Strain Seligo" /LENGTH=93 /DNA_ID=CAMNT_0053952191 /DNA_START=276 /DNA_END=557 /DNA_ORIENTATION=+